MSTLIQCSLYFKMTPLTWCYLIIWCLKFTMLYKYIIMLIINTATASSPGIIVTRPAHFWSLHIFIPLSWAYEVFLLFFFDGRKPWFDPSLPIPSHNTWLLNDNSLWPQPHASREGTDQEWRSFLAWMKLHVKGQSSTYCTGNSQ